jgi:hypothetical protein
VSIKTSIIFGSVKLDWESLQVFLLKESLAGSSVEECVKKLQAQIDKIP